MSERRAYYCIDDSDHEAMVVPEFLRTHPGIDPPAGLWDPREQGGGGPDVGTGPSPHPLPLAGEGNPGRDPIERPDPREEDIYADMPHLDRVALGLLKERVRRAVRELVEYDAAELACEETLHQALVMLERYGGVRLPELGELEVFDHPDGEPAYVVFRPAEGLLARIAESRRFHEHR